MYTYVYIYKYICIYIYIHIHIYIYIYISADPLGSSGVWKSYVPPFGETRVGKTLGPGGPSPRDT